MGLFKKLRKISAPGPNQKLTKTMISPSREILGIGPRELGLPDPIADFLDPQKGPIDEIPEPAAVPDEQEIERQTRRRTALSFRGRGGRQSTRLGGERQSLA